MQIGFSTKPPEPEEALQALLDCVDDTIDWLNYDCDISDMRMALRELSRVRAQYLIATRNDH